MEIFNEEPQNSDEAVINVRGKDKYVVIDIKRYKELREKELDLTYKEVMRDIKDIKYHTNI